jgi:hypothetical protein
LERRRSAESSSGWKWKRERPLQRRRSVETPESSYEKEWRKRRMGNGRRSGCCGGKFRSNRSGIRFEVARSSLLTLSSRRMMMSSL